MVRKLLLFSLSTLYILAVEVTVSLGNNGKQSYSLVEIVSETPYMCSHIEATHLRRDYVKCSFEKVPLSTPRSTENSFFKIEPYTVKREFFLEITPKFEGELYSQTLSTLDDKVIYKKKIEKSRIWLILGFKDKNPFFRSREYDGLNFPVKIKEYDYPTVGALDIGGFPIQEGRDQEDFIEYNALKRLYDKKDYKTLLSRIDRKLEKKEVNKLFMPEILAFKIKALNEDGDNKREVIEVGSPWIRAYTSHKDLPEIMLIVSKAYLDLGIINEANELLDTLIQEYPEDSYAEYATIYRGDRFAKDGKAFTAKQYYEKVLYNSDDIEVASLAAYRLARQYLVANELKKATGLYQKILKTNSKFFLKEYEESFNLAKELVDRKVPEVAGQIGEVLHNSLDKIDRRNKDLIINTARWYAKANKLEKALLFYDKFLLNYSYAKNIGNIRKEIDVIKFKLDKGSYKERLALYESVIEKYPNEEIAGKAKYKKMSLLLEEKKYDRVKEYLSVYENLDEELFPNIKEDVRRIARRLVKIYLDNVKCKNGVELLHKYNILLSDKYDETMVHCAMEVADYDLAIQLSNKYIDLLAPAESLMWQRKKMDAQFRKSNYIQYILNAKRVMRIEKALGETPDRESYITLFKAYHRNGDTKELEPLLKEAEEKYADEPRLLDMYKTIVEVALEEKNYNKAYDYGIKILNKQRIMNIDSFSPFVEFAIGDSALKLKEYGKAIDILETMVENEALPVDEILEGSYRLAELYQLNGEGDKSQALYQKCADTKGDKKWQALCKEKIKK